MNLRDIVNGSTVLIDTNGLDGSNPACAPSGHAETVVPPSPVGFGGQTEPWPDLFA